MKLSTYTYILKLHPYLASTILQEFLKNDEMEDFFEN